MLCLDGAEHLRQRKLLLPPFHGERMQRYARGHARGRRAPRSTRWPVGEPFALREHTQAITLEVILRAVFGVDGRAARLDRLRGRSARLLDWFSGPARAARSGDARPANPASGACRRRALAPVDAVLHAEIAERARGTDLEERADILSLLLLARDEDGEPMTDPELRDELLTLLVAGHETTATALAWAIERLMRTPGGAASGCARRRAPATTTYRDAVVKETLRLRPVVPVVAAPAHAAGRDRRLRSAGGRNVVASIYLVHRRAGRLPGAGGLPARALPRAAGVGHLRLAPVRRRHPALHRRGVRPVRDEGRAARDRRAAHARAGRRRGERAVRRAITLAPERGGQVRIL